MIRGSVDANLFARVRLCVRGTDGVELEVDAVIDTGFDDSLILPARTISSLGLKHPTVGQAFLADGSIKYFDIFSAEIEWGGASRTVQVSAVGDEALIGMALLADHELRIQVVPTGSVEIIPIP